MKHRTTSTQSLKSLNDLLPLISTLSNLPKWRERISSASLALMNKPYATNPLIGDAHTPEEFLVHSEHFDCVTFVETVLALANCNSIDDFQKHLFQIRYRNENLCWLERNHYMTHWIRENSAKGYIQPYSIGNESLEIEKSLSCLKDYPPNTELIVLEPVNIAMLDKLQKIYQDGDIIFFGSSKQDLDYFHLGLLFSGPQGQLILRHASRTAEKVLDEELDKFLERVDGCPGVRIVRPIDCRKS
jgi:hypothetical protein